LTGCGLRPFKVAEKPTRAGNRSPPIKAKIFTRVEIEIHWQINNLSLGFPSKINLDKNSLARVFLTHTERV
jgi:hypothetical protein